MARRIINDEMWTRLEPKVLEAKGNTGAPPKHSLREFMEAVLNMRVRDIRGVICLRNLVAGIAYICGFGDGRRWGYGSGFSGYYRSGTNRDF